MALDRAPHESLFSTELIITLCDHFWDFYSRKILIFCFLPYLFYFFCTIFYVSWYAVDGIPPEENGTLTAELVLRIIIVLSIIYFAFFELVAFFRGAKNYILDPFNYFDWLEFFLNYYIVSHIVREGDETDPASSGSS